jgi:D-galactarolactone cycloisomerase
MKLTVDTNCPWTPVEALEMARRFRPHDLLWLEEPVWPPEDWAGLARVRQDGGIALAAGENASNPIDFKHMFDASAVTYGQPSVTKIGGVSALREVGILAEAAGVTLVPHSPYFGPGLLATLHFLAAQPREPLVERIYATLEPDLFGGVTNAKNGTLAVPQGPGLGVDPDPAVIARYKTA